jgi:PAS domain S-box-containing protein
LRAALGSRGDFTLQLEAVAAGDRPVSLECAGRWIEADRGYVCLLHDITAATRAQSAAQAQAGLFRLLADNVPVLIAYYRASDLQCQFANKAYAERFGFDEQSIIGKTFAEVIGPEVASQIEPAVRKVTFEGRPAIYERTVDGPDGSTRWIEVHLLPHLGTEHETVGAYVLISDITKHRQAELALRESEERLAKFMQATAEGIVFHKDGFITDANPPVCALMGYSLE